MLPDFILFTPYQALFVFFLGAGVLLLQWSQGRLSWEAAVQLFAWVLLICALMMALTLTMLWALQIKEWLS